MTIGLWGDDAPPAELGRVGHRLLIATLAAWFAFLHTLTGSDPRP